MPRSSLSRLLRWPSDTGRLDAVSVDHREPPNVNDRRRAGAGDDKSSRPAPQSLTRDPIVVVDVGARWGIGEQWAALAPNVRVYGFDPDPEECARLNAASAAAGNSHTVYVPLALGEMEGSAVLHNTREPACSSLYPPIARLAQSLPALTCVESTGQTQVQITTLDSWCGDNDVMYIDAMKLDTQGSELNVLRGAEDALRHVQLLEIEVEFNPIYEGQPLFGDVDSFLRRRGFVLWRIDNLVHYNSRAEAPQPELRHLSGSDGSSVFIQGHLGQFYWAHAYYTRAELCPGGPFQPSRTQAQRAAAVARAARLPDLASSVLA